MKSYEFSVIIETSPQTEDELLDMADALGNTGCLDATICGHQEGAEAIFTRDAESLQDAIHSAVMAIEQAGFKVKRAQVERESIAIKT